MEWYEIVISILSGLITAIPLAVQLVKYVRQAVQEKNWGKLVSLVITLIQEAEAKFDNGADRKTWVLGMVEASAKTINYEVDLDQVSALIDSLCAMSKKVNVKKTEEVIE